MGFLLWILYGLAAGACASWLLGLSHEWYWNIIIGIVGSIVGGFVAGLFGIKSNNWIGSFVISVVEKHILKSNPRINLPGLMQVHLKW